MCIRDSGGGGSDDAFAAVEGVSCGGADVVVAPLMRALCASSCTRNCSAEMGPLSTRGRFGRGTSCEVEAVFLGARSLRRTCQDIKSLSGTPTIP